MARNRVGSTARPAAEAAKVSPRPQPPAPARRMPWWKSTVLFLLGVGIVGAVPVWLAGQVLGFWQVRAPAELPIPLPRTQPAPTASPGRTPARETRITPISGASIALILTSGTQGIPPAGE